MWRAQFWVLIMPWDDYTANLSSVCHKCCCAYFSSSDIVQLEQDTVLGVESLLMLCSQDSSASAQATLKVRLHHNHKTFLVVLCFVHSVENCLVSLNAITFILTVLFITANLPFYPRQPSPHWLNCWKAGPTSANLLWSSCSASSTCPVTPLAFSCATR